MIRGAFTDYLDVAQITLYAFFLFFAGLVFYLRREDKREGYPLESERSGAVVVQGFPKVPAPKIFYLPHGGTYAAPNFRPEPEVPAAPAAAFLGAPLEPLGNPMRDPVGTGAYALREDVPEYTWEKEPLIVPTRVLPGVAVYGGDADPRGMVVIGADRVVAGTVTELWVDRGEPQIRYLEVDVAGVGSRLLPVYYADIHQKARIVKVGSILGGQFAAVPTTKGADEVTKLEEDKITAYFAAGYLYAAPDRLGPLL